ncbi:hypothetical protein AB1A64_01205 [Ruegeria sp. ANG10]
MIQIIIETFIFRLFDNYPTVEVVQCRSGGGCTNGKNQDGPAQSWV